MTVATGPSHNFAVAPDQEIERRSSAAFARVRLAEEATCRHDLMNALTAVEGAASILVDDNLSPGDRAEVSRLLGSGVDRLRSLVTGGDMVPGPVSLSGVAGCVAREPRWAGRVEVDVAQDLTARGSSAHIAEALGQLLECGRAMVPAGRLVLEGRRHGDSVGLWLPLTGRRQMPRNLPVAASVAARVMQSQGGDVRTQTPLDAVPSIGICMPAAPEAPVPIG